MALQTTAVKLSSAALRLVSYVFLRWGLLPLLPPVAFTLFAVYLPAFVYSYFDLSQRDVVYEETETHVNETVAIRPSPPGHASPNNLLVIDQVQVKKATIVGDRKPVVSLSSTLLAGLPNPRRPFQTLLTLLINVACVAMVADRVYSEHYITGHDLSFVRPGYISDRQAKLLVREPDQSKMPVTFEIRTKDYEPPFDSPVWQTAGRVHETNNDTDFTAVITLPLMHNDQRAYEWRSSNGHYGEFVSAPKAGKHPDKFDGKFTFLSTSCIVNRLPYNPLDHPLSIPGMRHLANVLPGLGAQFMLFLGDFIYVDVPRWWGKNAADYRQKYRAVYASPEWPAVGQNLSWIHVLDDHEIMNDWDKKKTGVYAAAIDPWRHYHTAANPPPATRPASSHIKSDTTDTTWFGFSQGPADFFMMDTRSYRSNNRIPYDDAEKTMLGSDQLDDLFAFLEKPEPKGVTWKIIASSVPFTKNWPVNTHDTWGAFLSERRKILEAMWNTVTSGIGVVILSGDRHEFAATKFPPPAGSKWSENATVYEFSASPLSQFYSPIPTYRQTDDEDVEITYINHGHSKFGVITIEKVPNSDRSALSHRLFVDGVEAWQTTILSPEPTAPSPIAFWDRLLGSR